MKDDNCIRQKISIVSCNKHKIGLEVSIPFNMLICKKVNVCAVKYLITIGKCSLSSPIRNFNQYTRYSIDFECKIRCSMSSMNGSFHSVRYYSVVSRKSFLS